MKRARLLLRAAYEVVVAAAAGALVLWAWRADRAWLEIHATPNYCAVDAHGLSWLAMWRWIAVGAAVFFVAVVRRAKPALTLSVVATTAAALVVCDLALRKVKPRPGAPVVPIQLPAQRRDAQRGWALVASHTSVLTDDGRAISYAVNAKGDRARDENDLPDPARPTILFGGESITLGLGVTWQETYPARVGQRMPYQIVNCAVHGYGGDQTYLRVKQRLLELEHPAAVVTMTLADAIPRDVAGWRDRLQPDGRGGFEVVAATPEWWRTSPVRALLFDQIVPLHGDGAIGIERTFLRAIASEAHARGAYPLVVWTNYQRPCLDDDRGAPRIEHLVFDDLGVDHVHVDLDPTAIVRSDGHPNPSAHLVLADAVTRALSAHGL